MEIDRKTLYHFCHLEACNDAETSGYFDRYELEFKDLSLDEFDPLRFWKKGTEFGLTPDHSTIMAIQWLYNTGWNRADYHFRVLALEEKAGEKVERWPTIPSPTALYRTCSVCGKDEYKLDHTFEDPDDEGKWYCLDHVTDEAYESEVAHCKRKGYKMPPERKVVSTMNQREEDK
jgi:hypothetical protein